jgi:LAO/AO transport system kinase
MASRGALGGLAQAAPAAVRLLDAVGMEVVIVETVGVGQSEVAIAATADCVVLVLAPGGGDGVQAMKAGVLEIADLIVVNKADLPGADRTRSELAAAFRMRPAGGPAPKVLSAQADAGTGVAELLAHVGETIAERRRSGELQDRRAARLRAETLARAGRALRERLLEAPERWLEPDLVAALESGTSDPTGLGDRIADRVLARAAR